MCNRLSVFLVALVVSAYATVGYADPINFSTLSYLGTATPYSFPTGTGARLTDNTDPSVGPPPTGPSPAGAVWTQTPVSVGLGFTLSLDFRMSDGRGYRDPDGNPIGGDGFAFVIQNDPMGSQALGVGAGGLGYMYLSNSVALEFDTYWNDSVYGDPNGNHISLHSRGRDFNVPHHLCTGGSLRAPGYPTDLPGVPCTSNPALATALVGNPLNDGNTQTARIVYVPGELSVYLNSSFLFSSPLDLDALLALKGDRDAYIGFTAGTRYAYQNHDVLSADFSPVPEPATWLLLCVGLGTVALAPMRRKSS